MSGPNLETLPGLTTAPKGAEAIRVIEVALLEANRRAPEKCVAGDLASELFHYAKAHYSEFAVGALLTSAATCSRSVAVVVNSDAVLSFGQSDLVGRALIDVAAARVEQIRTGKSSHREATADEMRIASFVNTCR